MKANLCQVCGGPSEVLRSRETADEIYSRRRQCLDPRCLYRWTTFEEVEKPLRVTKEPA